MEENEDRRTLELFPRARDSYEVALGRFMKRRIRSTSSTERILTRQPEEEVWLTVGKTYSVCPRRPHLVANAGDTSAVFLV